MAVVVSERALDIDGMRVMTLDEVAVIAVHGAHEIGQGSANALGQTPPEAGRAACNINGEIGQRATRPGVFPENCVHDGDLPIAFLYRFDRIYA